MAKIIRCNGGHMQGGVNLSQIGGNLERKEPLSGFFLLRFALAVATVHGFNEAFEYDFGRTETPPSMNFGQHATNSLYRYISLFFKGQGTVQLFENRPEKKFSVFIYHPNKSIEIYEYRDIGSELDSRITPMSRFHYKNSDFCPSSTHYSPPHILYPLEKQ